MRRNRSWTRHALAGLVAGLTLLPSYASAETLGSDPTFGGGQVVVDINGGMDEVVAIALQPDGKVILTGIVDAYSAAADAMVLRFRTDGALDPTFGTGGLVRLAYGGHDSAGALALQPDGKVLVAVNDGGGDCVNFPRDCTGLVRLNPDGGLDATFKGAQATNRWPSGIVSINVLPDGRMMLVGSARRRGQTSFFATRLTAEGVVDPAFGTESGFAYADFGTSPVNAARAGAVQPDGKVLLVGATEGNRAVARLTADGLADPTFGTNGQVLTAAPNESTTAMALQPDGRIVVLGRVEQGATLTRYRPDGALDASFGRGGIVGRSPSDPKGKVTFPQAMALDAAGRILVAGNDSVDRYLPSGALDVGFSARFIAPGDAGNSLTAIASRPDGRVVVAGARLPVAINNEHWDVLIARTVDGEAIGYLDAAVPRSGGSVVSVWGWAVDRDAPTPVQVKLYVDGSFRQAVAATASRPDIGAAFPGVGNDHGFQVDLSLAAGSHSVCAELVNQGTGTNRWLGCHGAVVSPNPYGLLEYAGRAPGGVAVSGWAIDPDTAGVVSVQMYVDGTLAQTVPARQFRPEVGTSAPASGNSHGFRSVVPVARGTHQVCAYALNQGPGTSQVVGCRNVVVTVDPIGALDEVVSMGGQVGVGVAGWAIDPDVAGPVTVYVTSDGAYVGSVVADLAHTGLEQAVPNYGPNHGFNAFLAGPPAGRHNVCAFAVNQGAGTHSLLGCKYG